MEQLFSGRWLRMRHLASLWPCWPPLSARALVCPSRAAWCRCLRSVFRPSTTVSRSPWSAHSRRLVCRGFWARKKCTGSDLLCTTKGDLWFGLDCAARPLWCRASGRRKPRRSANGRERRGRRRPSAIESLACHSRTNYPICICTWPPRLQSTMKKLDKIIIFLVSI